MVVRVKVCGITNGADAASAARAGVDAIGINLVSGPRKVDLERADEVVRAVGPMVTPVVLVKLEDGEPAKSELAWAGRRRVSHLQLYGEVTGRAIRRLADEGFRPIVVAGVKDADFADEVNALLAECGGAGPAAILLDAYCPKRAGGTGETFDWRWVNQARQEGRMEGWGAVLLGGGLRSDNVAEAIRQVRPYGVDVSSGVESAPGKKDESKMCAFVTAAKTALRENR